MTDFVQGTKSASKSIGFRQRSLPVANAISNFKSWTIGVLTMVITFGELGAWAAFVFVSCYSFTFFVILESPSWSVWCMHMSLSLGTYSRTIWNIISASSTSMYQLWTCFHLGLQKTRAVCPVSRCRWAIASCFFITAMLRGYVPVHSLMPVVQPAAFSQRMP